MLSREELVENYRHFSDARIVELANEPDGLSEDALEVLKIELSRRKLEVEVQAQSLPIDPNLIFPDSSDELKIKYPTALQIFSFEKKTILTFSLLFFGFALFFIYLSLPIQGMFSWKLVIGFLFFAISSYILLKVRSKKAMMVVMDEAILFKQKRFVHGKLAIIEMLLLFLSNKFLRIHKSEIKKVVRSTHFTRTHNLCFEMLNGDEVAINVYAREEYLDQIGIYLQNYLERK